MRAAICFSPIKNLALSFLRFHLYLILIKVDIFTLCSIFLSKQSSWCYQSFESKFIFELFTINI